MDDFAIGVIFSMCLLAVCLLLRYYTGASSPDKVPADIAVKRPSPKLKVSCDGSTSKGISRRTRVPDTPSIDERVTRPTAVSTSTFVDAGTTFLAISKGASQTDTVESRSRRAVGSLSEYTGVTGSSHLILGTPANTVVIRSEGSVDHSPTEQPAPRVTTSRCDGSVTFVDQGMTGISRPTSASFLEPSLPRVLFVPNSHIQPSSARPTAGASTSRIATTTTIRTADATNSRTAGESTIRTAGASTSRTADATNSRTAGASTSRTAGASTSRTADATNSRTAGAATSRKAGASTSRTADASTSRTADATNSRTAGASTSRTASASTSHTADATNSRTAGASTSRTADATNSRTRNVPEAPRRTYVLPGTLGGVVILSHSQSSPVTRPPSSRPTVPTPPPPPPPRRRRTKLFDRHVEDSEPEEKKLDLRGLFLREAMATFFNFFASMENMYSSSGYNEEDRYIYVVTGYGKLTGRRPVIKPAVQEFLDQNDIRHNWLNEGLVMIDFCDLEDEVSDSEEEGSKSEAMGSDSEEEDDFEYL